MKLGWKKDAAMQENGGELDWKEGFWGGVKLN